MGLTPVADKLWCPRPATQDEYRQKLRLLRTRPATVLQTTAHSEPAQALLLAELERRHPSATPADLAMLANIGNARGVATAALMVPEDLCVLQLIDGDYRLVAACVTAPSYWHLPDKIGRTLQDVHHPVPELNATLGQRMQSFFAGLPSGRVFLRRNWFLHASSELFQPQPEDRTPVQTAKQALDLTLRSETQTLRRLSPDVVVFTIATNCEPLRDIRQHPKAAESLLRALRSKTPAERRAASQDAYDQGVVALLETVIES